VRRDANSENSSQLTAWQTDRRREIHTYSDQQLVTSHWTRPDRQIHCGERKQVLDDISGGRIQRLQSAQNAASSSTWPHHSSSEAASLAACASFKHTKEW